MWRRLRTVLDWPPARSRAGVTAIEYGLIAALISVVIISAVTLIGTNMSSVFNRIATTL